MLDFLEEIREVPKRIGGQLNGVELLVVNPERRVGRMDLEPEETCPGLLTAEQQLDQGAVGFRRWLRPDGLHEESLVQRRTRAPPLMELPSPDPPIWW